MSDTAYVRTTVRTGRHPLGRCAPMERSRAERLIASGHAVDCSSLEARSVGEPRDTFLSVRDTISRADVYLGDDLAWSKATVLVRADDVKVRPKGDSIRLILRGTGSPETRRVGRDKQWRWTGTDALTGETKTITVVKADCGCSK